jgi:transmembrane sensor
VRLQEAELDDQAITEWMQWCEADPLNRQAFEAMAEVHELAGGMGDMAGEPAPATSPSMLRKPSWRSWRAPAAAAAGLAAVVVLALAGAPMLGGPTVPEPFRAEPVSRLETGAAAHQSVRLVDGSQVDIGGRSALSVRYSPRARLVVADHGEMFFRVKHNPDRPFVVEAGPVTITDVGTAFSVEREGDSVSVAVAEGLVEVRVSPAPKGEGRQGVALRPMVLRVSAGQRIRFDRGELTQSAGRGEVDLASSWREGRLEFKDEPLRLVVARVNRYSARQITITDPSIEDLRVTGVIYADRVDSWLDGLEQVLPVRVARTGSEQVAIAPAVGAPRRRAGG